NNTLVTFLQYVQCYGAPRSIILHHVKVIQLETERCVGTKSGVKQECVRHHQVLLVEVTHACMVTSLVQSLVMVGHVKLCLYKDRITVLKHRYNHLVVHLVTQQQQRRQRLQLQLPELQQPELQLLRQRPPRRPLLKRQPKHNPHRQQELQHLLLQDNQELLLSQKKKRKIIYSFIIALFAGATILILIIIITMTCCCCRKSDTTSKPKQKQKPVQKPVQKRQMSTVRQTQPPRGYLNQAMVYDNVAQPKKGFVNQSMVYDNVVRQSVPKVQRVPRQYSYLQHV
ncbi:Hypothetical predicted protein, partial [Mytilus galloprovincialis]